MKSTSAGGGWRSIRYVLSKAREAGGVRAMYRALRTPNACKTCALGMGGQAGGMANESGHFPEVCKKSVQAMAADMQGAVSASFFSSNTFGDLARLTPKELESAGRLARPMYAGPLDTTYREVEWDAAFEIITEKLKSIHPHESFFYASGRSSNEAGFLIQLLARIYGTNNVNNCSYYCHQASGVGLASVTGSGTATIVLEDLDRLGAGDVFFLIGANPASNHPRLMTTLADFKRRGGTVVVVNPLIEPGLVRFKVPSRPMSLLFGTEIADEYVQPAVGGDLAFLTGVAKRIVDSGAEHAEFVQRHCDGWEAFAAAIRATDWRELVAKSGVSRGTMEHIGDLYATAGSSVFAWAMGITHHSHGVETVQAIANLAMTRGMLGRPGAGLMPIRGHSNVQGIGSVGVTPALKASVWKALERDLGVAKPDREGLDTMACMFGAAEGRLRAAVCLGGNLFGSNPDAAFAATALQNLELIVYLSTTLNTGHAIGRGRETIILPVLARDEEPEPTTQESMFNFVRLSDGGQPRHWGPRSEVSVLAEIGTRVDARGTLDWESMREHHSIRGAIAKVIPGFSAIGHIDATRQEFQIEGRTFHQPHFATDTGNAKFHVLMIPGLKGDAEQLRLMTVRSEGQFNTVVYEEEDVYRGQERRDVILMNEVDIGRRGLHPGATVTVKGTAGELAGIVVRVAPIAEGNAAMYFPEANVLLSRQVDPSSRTPAFKGGLVTLVGDEGREVPYAKPEPART